MSLDNGHHMLLRPSFINRTLSALTWSRSVRTLDGVSVIAKVHITVSVNNANGEPGTGVPGSNEWPAKGRDATSEPGTKRQITHPLAPAI